MALLERLAILITADASGAINEFKKTAASAEADLKKAGDASNNFSGQMTKVGAAMMGAGAGLLAVGVSAASSTTDLGREVLKLQRYTGMTAEQASELAYASKMSGVQVDSLAVGLGRLSKAAEANNPAFEKLGIDVRDSHGNLRSMGELLPDVAEKFKEMPNGPEKTALALQLFGRSGMDLMPFLNKGKDGIKELSDEASKMGLVLNGDNIAAIKNHIVSQRELGAAFDGLKTKIGMEMIPILDGFTNIVKDIPGPVLDVIGPLVVFGGGFLTAGGAIGMLVGQLKNLAPAFTALTGWLMDLNPLTMVVVGLGIAIATVATIMKVFGDNQSRDQASIDNFSNALKEQGAALDAAVVKTINAKVESKGLTETMQHAGINMGNFKQAVLDGGSAMKDFADLMKLGHSPQQQADAMNKLTDSQRAYAQSVLDAEANGQIDYNQRQKLLTLLGDLNGEYDTAKSSTDLLSAATEQMTTKGTLLAQAEQAAADATSNHEAAVKTLNDALHGAIDPFTGMIAAEQKNKEAQVAVADAARDVVKAYADLQKAQASGNEKDIAEKTDAMTQAQKKYQDAQKGSIDSAIAYQTSLGTLQAKLQDGTITYDDAIRKIDEMEKKNLISAETAKYFKDRINDLKGALDALPPQVSVNVSAETKAAIDKLKAFVGLTSQDKITLEDINAYSSQYPSGPGKAMGGRVGGMALGGRPSQPYLIGELGPELFVPDSAGTILTADKTAGMLSPSSSSSVVNNITINMPEGVNPDEVVKAIRRYERVNGTQWRSAY